MSDIKPIGFKPDGSHINKGAMAIVLCFLIGLYCIVSDAPFGYQKSVETPPVVVVEETPVVVETPKEK